MVLFGFTKNSIHKNKPKITDMIPDFFANLNEFSHKGGYN